MSPTDKKPDKEKKSPKGLEDLPTEWVEEDREIEGRTPSLAEVEEDTSETS